MTTGQIDLRQELHKAWNRVKSARGQKDRDISSQSERWSNDGLE